MKVKIALLGTLTGGLMLLAQSALAHDLWLSADNPQAKQPLKITIGYGHAFPAGEPTEPEKVMPPYVLGAKGRLDTLKGEGLTFTTKEALEPGSHLVVGGRLPQWYSKTPEGTKDLPKDQAPGAVSCVQSAKYAKAIVTLGQGQSDVTKPVGQVLEIVPMANPAGLKAGGQLPLLVLFKGQPLAQAKVSATHAGFQGEKKGAMAFSGVTGADGKIMLPLVHAGQWLVLAKHELPFADQAQCDKEMHGASLTFELK